MADRGGRRTGVFTRRRDDAKEVVRAEARRRGEGVGGALLLRAIVLSKLPAAANAGSPVLFPPPPRRTPDLCKTHAVMPDWFRHPRFRIPASTCFCGTVDPGTGPG